MPENEAFEMAATRAGTAAASAVPAAAAKVAPAGAAPVPASSAAPREIDMTATAIATQKLDSVDRPGWLKVVAPAKVNLFLGIGARREDGYHNAHTILHALNLHDVLYLRCEPAAPGAGLVVETTLEGRGGLEVPDIASEDNIATKAVRALAKQLGRNQDETLTARIVKNIPAQAGLGGGSTNAAAALVGAATLWGANPYGDEVEAAARETGADVAFFLHGGCGYFEGTGDTHLHDLQPSKASVVLVKPTGGVSTAEAYRAFDEGGAPVSEAACASAAAAASADDVALFNNLAAASEAIHPQLAEVREWLAAQPGVGGPHNVLLCGSGSCTFAKCESFASATALVAEAQKRGWWARATNFGSIRAAVVSQ